MRIVPDPVHGLNPGIELCFFCNKEKSIVLFGSALKGERAPHKAVYDHAPCDACANLMKQGVLLISIDEKKSAGNHKNPWRTGGWVVVKDAFIQKVFQPEVAIDVIKKRVAFLSDEAWDLFGLPRGEVKENEEVHGDEKEG